MNDSPVAGSQAQIDELTKIFADANLEALAPQRFCEFWPDVKEGLTALRDVLAMFPGVSALVIPAVSIVITAGSAAANVYCKK
jgi:hypothetical protein